MEGDLRILIHRNIIGVDTNVIDMVFRIKLFLYNLFVLLTEWEEEIHSECWKVKSAIDSH